MKKIWLSALTVALVSTGALTTASAEPQDVKIVDFTYAGTGCPAGSVGASISDDRDSLIVLFDSFVAKIPPGSFDRKNCQLAIKLRFDPSWSFTLVRVDYRGFAALKPGSWGQEKSTYFFQGVPPAGDASAQTTIYGPYIGDYARSDNLGLHLWSPCTGTSKTLVINSQVRVQGTEAQMTVDSITGKVVHVYSLDWRRCP